MTLNGKPLQKKSINVWYSMVSADMNITFRIALAKENNVSILSRFRKGMSLKWIAT